MHIISTSADDIRIQTVSALSTSGPAMSAARAADGASMAISMAARANRLRIGSVPPPGRHTDGPSPLLRAD
jgi:hypothetical protein